MRVDTINIYSRFVYKKNRIHCAWDSSNTREGIKDSAKALWESDLIQDVALGKLEDKAKSYFEIVDGPMAEGKIHLSLEDVRIFDIAVAEAKLVDPPDDAPEIRVRITHPDMSLLRGNGRVYSFSNTGRSWDTLVRHEGGKTSLDVQGPDDMDDSLIQHVLGIESSKSPLRIRPSAWSDLTIQRRIMDMKSRYDGQFSELALYVRYTARDMHAKQLCRSFALTAL